jgi:5'-deoxynucleotidase YfbR-like HD superfamily hydrolase
MSMTVTPSVMRTYTGVYFNPLEPDPALINIEDIAQGLSNICRFAGQIEFYSVAQHSDHVAWLLPPEKRLKALLHDAPEAYIGDVVAPLKILPIYDFYREIEDKLMDAICERFGLEPGFDQEIKDADQFICEQERRSFKRVADKPDFDIIPWTQTEAKDIFLEDFRIFNG